MSDFNADVIRQFRENNGAVGGPFEGARMILVHSIGARSGAETVSPLMWFPDGDRILIVASAAGAPKNPAWYHNVLAHPEVEVEVGGNGDVQRYRAVAEELPRAERDAKWVEITAAAPGFAGYQEKTSRIIPVIALTRA
ncbi:nitroreductase family deazaflavin-dependent oxidoreductase [Nakamurella sp. YIM 132087]|uniref:Nitroreductase family deazaflavin-dependent oxidoreductase n=1 Tax=Nakamurella alba TaxID=2665158 RepID=A0A7K1FQ37_9ACTN|nr:nitroreductase family deazaflavin-dependent oxidoreductase [Nakamurella alba]MTD16256.1 nitroreductase family deazaflavin-dependent oxidoreductase [Nakamurella alba]